MPRFCATPGRWTEVTIPPLNKEDNIQKTTKRVIAREGVTFFVLLVVGLTIAPLVVITIGNSIAGFTPLLKPAMLPPFYEGLFSHRYWPIAWLVALAPYIIYQLGRSLVWAVKTAKDRRAHNAFTKSDRVKIIAPSI